VDSPAAIKEWCSVSPKAFAASHLCSPAGLSLE
jgi:hypothetical protein